MDENEVKFDETVARFQHTIHDITADECKEWANNPITKAMINYLDDCGILVALQYGDKDDNHALLHLIVPFDIKKSMVDRARTRQ